MNTYVVYKIVNKVNRKYYIGSTSNFIIRKSEHFSQLKKGIHCNKKLQQDFNIYGESSFDMFVVETNFKSRQQMLCMEYELILKSFGNTYNIDTKCPVFNSKDKSFDHKVYLNEPKLEVSTIASMKKNKELKKASNKMYHPHLDKLIEKKIMRDKFKNNL